MASQRNLHWSGQLPTSVSWKRVRGYELRWHSLLRMLHYLAKWRHGLIMKKPHRIHWIGSKMTEGILCSKVVHTGCDQTITSNSVKISAQCSLVIKNSNKYWKMLGKEQQIRWIIQLYYCTNPQSTHFLNIVWSFNSLQVKKDIAGTEMLRKNGELHDQSYGKVSVQGTTQLCRTLCSGSRWIKHMVEVHKHE